MSENNSYTRQDRDRDLQSYLSGNPPPFSSEFWTTELGESQKSLAPKTVGDSSSSQQPDGPSAAATTTVSLDSYQSTILDMIKRSTYTTEPETQEAGSATRLHRYAQDLAVLAKRSSLNQGARPANDKEMKDLYGHEEEDGAKERILALIKSLETEVLPLDRFIPSEADD